MPNYTGRWSSNQQFQARGQGLWPRLPGAPTIGTATAGNTNCASVTFTAPADPGVPSTLTYIATSTPGSFTGSGSSSPVVVTGLTTGTAYTFRVRATNNAGSGACSAASNSITARVVTCATYTTPGTYTWVAPACVTSVAIVAVGGGAGGLYGGGGGAGLGYRNAYAVSPGTSYTVVVGAGGTCSSSGANSFFVNACSVVSGRGGGRSSGGSYSGTGGGSGGNGNQGGGGAGGYAGNGGSGGSYSAGLNGLGGGGGGGGGTDYYYGGAGGGGGVGLLGQGGCGGGGRAGSSCVGSAFGGGGGSSGNQGSGGSYFCNPPCAFPVSGRGGAYGGGAGCGQFASTFYTAGAGGAVRIVWAGGTRGTPSFPSTNVGA